MDSKKELPQGWNLKRMPEVVRWSSGGTPKATERLYYENGTIPWLIIGDLNDGIVSASATKITKLGLDNSSAKLIPEGTLLVAMYGSIGKLGITGFECCTNQAIAFAKELYGVDTKYLFFYLMMIKPKLVQKGKGGTQKNISLTVLNSLYIPLPPLPTQHQIVSRIESLFAELNKAVEHLRTAQQQLKIYRQAVLNHWLNNDDGKWETVKLGEVIEKPTYGTSKKCDYGIDGIGVIRIPNIGDGFINDEDLKYAVFSEEEKEKYSLKNGDLLTIRSNGSVDLVGKCALISCNEEKYLFAGYLIRLRPNGEKANSKFLLYTLESHNLRVQIEEKAKSTSGVNNINSVEIQSLQISLPPLSDQQRIVKEIETRLSQAEAAEARIAEALQKTEALRQSILKKAFSGEFDL